MSKILTIVIVIVLSFYMIECGSAIKDKEVKSLKKELQKVKDQRDILSDAIRNAYDNGQRSAMNYADDILSEIDCQDSIENWSYCY